MIIPSKDRSKPPSKYRTIDRKSIHVLSEAALKVSIGASGKSDISLTNYLCYLRLPRKTANFKAEVNGRILTNIIDYVDIRSNIANLRRWQESKHSSLISLLYRDFNFNIPETSLTDDQLLSFNAGVDGNILLAFKVV